MIGLVRIAIQGRRMSRYEREYFKRLEIDDRCKKEAQWLIDHPKDTIRRIAKEFCIGKSQVHRDLHYMKYIDDDIYVQCMKILSGRRKW